MQIEKIAIDKLKSAEYNPRKDLKPGDPEFEKLRRSIESFGYVEPAIWNKRTGNIVGGHQRIKVLKYLGHTEADCVVVDLDEQQEKALNIGLNKISGLWDDEALTALLKDLNDSGFDLSLTGFDASETADLFGEGALENTKEDDFDEDKALEQAEKAPITQTGDLWELGKHKLLCGDACKKEDISRLMSGTLADLMVTDPPYNVDYEDLVEHRNESGHGTSRGNSEIKNDHLSDEKFKMFLLAFYKTAFEHLRGGAGIYIFHSSRESVNFMQAMREAGFKYSQTLVWIKNHFVMGRQDYQWMHEPILYGWKEADGGHYFINDRTNTTIKEQAELDFKKMTKDEMRELLERVFGQIKATTVRCDRPMRSLEHPTMKPIKLCAELIFNSSKVGDTLLEPFCGSGSTIIAAEQLARTCLAVELEPKYCDVIVRRFYQNFPHLSIRLNGKAVDKKQFA
jgi:DNA modification methylase